MTRKAPSGSIGTCHLTGPFKKKNGSPLPNNRSLLQRGTRFFFLYAVLRILRRVKTTTDVIEAAKRITDVATQLDKVARGVAGQCPDTASKTDLIACLQRISLYTHQLKITSKVKADVQFIPGELIVSSLDSATSLIQVSPSILVL